MIGPAADFTNSENCFFLGTIPDLRGSQVLRFGRNRDKFNVRFWHSREERLHDCLESGLQFPERQLDG